MISYLKNVNDGSLFYLLNKDLFVVGRKDCDFLISNDQSISRKHAFIRIKDGKVSLEDNGSKYNTMCNGKKMEPNIEKVLNNNDEIQFGVINSKYRLQQHKIVTTGTRLNSSQKIKLKSDLTTIGGQYTENWTSDCTHLTVEEITLTVKVLHAIIDDKPIVKPSYWSKYVENAAKNLPPPLIDKHNKPPIAEALLNNMEFESNPRRKSLFKGKLFVFSKENTRKQMEDIIRKAGGISISWEKDPMPLEDIKNSPKEFIIIQTPDCTDNPDLNEVIKHFSKQGKRTIPLQEIATAIVLCSCDKDCNPNFNRVEEVFPLSQPSEPTQNNALVPGTQSQYFTVKKYKEEDDDVQMIIPDTIESELVSYKKSEKSEIGLTDKKSLKRPTCTDVEENPFKKPKVEKANIPGKSGQSSRVKQETMNNFLSKGKVSQKQSSEKNDSMNESKSDIKQNPFLNKNKKFRIDVNTNNKTDNPFKSIKTPNDISQVDDDNPFKMSSGKKKRVNDDDDISAYNCKKKKDEIFSSTRLENNLDRTNDFSRASKIKCENTMWYSKDSTTNTTTDVKENFENSFDADLQSFIDKFKDTVVVEVITQLPKRPTIFQDVVDGGNNSKRHNFKRFVKVMSIRPQRIIFGANNCVAVGPKDVTGIADSRRERHFSEDEVGDTLKIKKKAPKKFLF